MDDQQQLLTCNQICALLGVSRKTVYNWIDRGMLQPTKIDEKVFVRFLKEDIDNILILCNKPDEVDDREIIDEESETEYIKRQLFYVYVYLDTRRSGSFKYDEFEFEFEPIYVGKGLNKRAWTHILEAKKNYKKPLYNRIRQIIYETKEDPKIVFFNDFGMYEALNLERRLIKLIGRYDFGFGPLFNNTDGGESGGNEYHIVHKFSNSGGHSNLEDDKLYKPAYLAEKCKVTANTLIKWMIHKKCRVYRLNRNRNSYFIYGKDFKRFFRIL